MAERSCIYLDANVFIYAIEGDPEIADLAGGLFAAAETHGAPLATSELTLAEVLVRPERDRRPDRKQSFLDLLCFSGLVTLLPITRQILIDSATYRAVGHPGSRLPGQDRRNFLPDAIHVLSAMACGATDFVSQDRRIRLPDGMRAIPLDADPIRHLIDRLP